MPLNIAGGNGSTSIRPSIFLNVLSLISISPSPAMLSNLAAIFTAIPIEVNSFFLSEPKMPENTFPVDIPIPILSLNPSWLLRLLSISFAFRCIAIADLTALTASSEWATGDPKITMFNF